MDHDVHLRRFDNALEAHLARARLAERGIRAFVDGEAAGTTWGVPIGTEEGIRLLVRREDFAAADVLLGETADPVREATSADASAAGLSSEEDSVEIPTPEEPGAEADARAWRLRAFSIVLLPVSLVASFVLPMLPVFMVLVVIALVSLRRARDGVSAKGRRFLRHAWIAIAVLTALPLVVIALVRFAPHG